MLCVSCQFGKNEVLRNRSELEENDDDDDEIDSPVAQRVYIEKTLPSNYYTQMVLKSIAILENLNKVNE